MMRLVGWRLLAPLAALVLAACSGPSSAPVANPSAASDGAQNSHKPLDDKKTPKAAAPVFSYRAAGRRDPFRSYLLDEAARRRAERSQRRVEETETFELNQYHVSAVLTGTSQPKAMVEDPTGKAFVVRIGARLGRSGGRVTRIDSAGLQVVEENIDPHGVRSQVATSLNLPVPNTDDSAPGLGATP